MKLTIIITTFISCIFLINCTPKQNIQMNNGKKMDTQLVGTWGGSAQKGSSNISDFWSIERKADGTFKMSIVSKVGGRSQRYTKTGTWWVDNNQYFEKNDNDDKAQITNYKVLNAKQIQFNRNSEDDKTEYTETKK